MPAPYPPVHYCIYCGVPEQLAGPQGLTDEHIIPYAFGGEEILPNSSCCFCSDETHAFEGKMAGKMLEMPRAHFHWKSRKRKRPKTLKAWTQSRGYYNVKIADHPGTMAFPCFEPPGILTGLPPPKDGTMQLTNINFAWEPDFLKKLQEVGGTIQPFDIACIARTVAKIAHAFSVAEHGRLGFEPTLPRIILGTDDRYSHFVGNPPISSGEATDTLHTLSSQWLNDILLVKVGLYSRFGITPYWVVSGLRKP